MTPKDKPPGIRTWELALLMKALKDDEIQYLSNNVMMRCKDCGHLEIFHDVYDNCGLCSEPFKPSRCDIVGEYTDDTDDDDRDEEAE